MLTPDTMRTIMWDMRRETPPDATYTGEMKRWRRETEAELAHYRIEHPDAQLEIPEELPNASDINASNPYAPAPKKDEFNESDHPRDESGKFGAGGGPAHKAALTDREHQLLHAMANTPRQKGSDSHVLKKIGATPGEGVALAQSARQKLGLTPQHNLRQHAIEMQKRGEIKVPESAKPSTETAAPKENDKPSAKGVEAAHEAHTAEHAKPGAHEQGGEGKHGGEGHGEDDFEKGKEEGEKEHANVVEKVTEFAKGAGEVVAGEEASKIAGALALFHAGKKEGGEGEKKEGGKEHPEGHGRGHKENKLGHDPHPKNPKKGEGKEHGPKHIEKQTAAMEGHPIPDKTD